MRLPNPVIIFILGAALACQRSENRYLTRSVPPNELFGTWVATPDGIAGLRFAGHTKHLSTSDHEVVLRPDGSCSYRSFRSATDTSGADEGFITSECEWSLARVRHQALMIRLRDQRADTLGPYFYFDEENGRLVLWQYAGDPDALQYVEFVKQTSEPK
jgi:hypothetical protein